MTTQRVQFEFVGKDKVTPVANRVRASLSGLSPKVSGLSSRFSGLTGRLWTFAGNIRENVLPSLTKLGKAAGVAAGLVVAAFTAMTVAVYKFGRKAIDAASHAMEMMSKFRVVFGDMANGVIAYLGRFAEAVGRSKYALYEMAAQVQDTFVPMGFARDQAAKLSEVVTKLVVDVASFNDVAQTHVMENFTSALVGVHQAVKKYGVVITEAKIKQELLNLGFKGGYEAATEQMKVLARLAILFKETKDAQGDAARTADSWANVWRAIKDTLHDVNVETGKLLIDALLPLAIKLRDFIRVYGPQFVTWMQNMIAAITDFLTAVETRAGPAFDAFARGIIAMQIAASNVFAAIGPIASNAMHGLGQLIAIGLQVISGLWDKFGNVFLGWWSLIWNETGNVLKAILLVIYGMIQTALNAISGDWGTAWGWMRHTLVVIGSYMAHFLLQFGKYMVDTIKAALLALGDLWLKAWNWLNRLTGGALEGIANIVKRAMRWLIRAFGAAWDGVLGLTNKALKGLVRGVANAVSSMASAIARFLEKIPGMGAIAAKLRGVAVSIKQWGEEAANDLDRFFEKISWQSMVDRFEETAGEFKAKVKDLAKEIGDLINELAEQIDWENFAPDPERVTEIWKDLKDALELSSDAVKTEVPSMLDYLRQLMDMLKKMAKQEKKDDGKGASKALKDRFAEMREQLKKTLEYIDFQLKQGLISPLDAIKAKIQAWMTFMQAAFAAGFKDAAQEAADQIKRLNEELEKLGDGVDAVQAARDAMQELESSIRSAFDAVRYVASNGGLTAAIDVELVTGALENIRPQVKALFEWLNRLYGDIADLAPKAAVAADAVNKAVSPIRTLLEAMNALYGASRGRLDGVLRHTRPRLQALIEWLARLYDDIKESTPRAMAAADAVAEIIKPVRDMIAGMDALYSAGRGRLDGVLSHIRPRLQAIIEWLARLWVDISDNAGEAASAARVVGEIVKPISDLIEGMGTLYSVGRGRLDGVLKHTRPRLQALIEWLARLWPDVRNTSPAAQAAADMIDKIVAPIKDMMEAMSALYNAGRGRLDGVLRETRPRLQALIEWLARLWKDLRDVAPNARVGAALIADAVKPVRDMLEVMSALYNARTGRLNGILRELRPRLIAIVNWLDRLWKDIRAQAGNVQAAGQTVEVVADAVKGVTAMLQAIASLRTVDDTDDRMTYIIRAMRLVYDRIKAMADDAKIIGLERVKTFADATGAVFDGLKAVIDLNRSLLAGFIPAPDSYWDDLFAAVKKVMGKLDEWAKGDFRDFATDAVKSLAEVMASVFSGLTDAMTLFKGLRTYTGIVEEDLAAFLDDVALALHKFGERAHGDLSNLADETSKQVAEAMGVIFEELKGAFDFFSAMSDETTQAFLSGFAQFGSKFQRAIANLIEAIQATLIAFKDYVTNKLDADWLPVAVQFAQDMGAVLDNLKKGLDLFKDIATSQLPSLTQLQAFIDAVIDLFDVLQDKLGESSSEIGQQGGQIAQAIRQAGRDAVNTATPVWQGFGAQIAAAFMAGLHGALTPTDLTALARGELLIRKQVALSINATVTGDLSSEAESKLVDRIVTEVINALQFGG